MVLAQVQQAQGQNFREVVKQQGLKGLYHGWRATLYRDVYFNMAFFTFREIIVSQWKRWSENDPSPWKRVVLGIPAGCIAAVVACPFDVVKTRMQGKELLGESQFVSVVLLEEAGPAVPHMVSAFKASWVSDLVSWYVNWQ